MSKDGDLLNLDFNSLRTLRLVYRFGSFTAAADELGVKQSTVSYTIDRLRKSLADPLIVRQGGQNVPTERCRELIPMIDRILAEANTMENPETFDPSRVRARFNIICSSFGLKVLLPEVFRRLQSEAPGIRLEIEQHYHGVANLLLEGKTDIALVFNEIEENGIYSHPRLCVDVPVCIMDPKNPLANKSLTLNDLSEARHVEAHLWPGWRPYYTIEAERLGATIDTVGTVSDATYIPSFIQGTTLISGMPSMLADTFGAQIAKARFPFELEIVMNMYWSAASNRSPLNTWLRQLLIEEAAGLGPVGVP